ncbi:MAG TPA: TetR/AcrR family transcriptional regulator [Acidimicrobiales bacterium]
MAALEAEGPAAVPGTAAWWRARAARDARRRPRSDGLTLDRITAAAVTVIDDEGLDALTMRRLADELGAGAASLYRHVANRDELLVEILDHVLGELREPPPFPDWRSGVDWLARELHRVLARHHAVVDLLPGDRLLGPNAMRARELGLRHLVAHGFGHEDATQVHAVLVGWVLGTSMLSMGSRRRVPGDVPRTEVYRRAAADRYPTVRELARVGLPRRDVVFDLGLTALLDGIEVRYRR